jgi:anti-anti-sigma factor
MALALHLCVGNPNSGVPLDLGFSPLPRERCAFRVFGRPTLPNPPSLNPGDHVCLLYEENADRDSYVGDFVRAGLEAGEKVLWVAGGGASEVAELMAGRGFDVSDFVDSGQLVVKGCTETYLGSGTFDAEEMLDCIRGEVRASEAEGYPRMRITGDLSWASPDAPGSPELVEYERAVDEIYRDTGSMGVCQYDTTQLAPAALANAVHAHRAVVSQRSQEVLHTPLLTLLVITRDANGVLSLYGDIDYSNIGEFGAALDAAISSPGNVVLDLTHLQFIDIAGLRVLERQATRLSKSGDRLVLSSPPAFLERVLEVLDLDELIDVAA